MLYISYVVYGEKLCFFYIVNLDRSNKMAALKSKYAHLKQKYINHQFNFHFLADLQNLDDDLIITCTGSSNRKTTHNVKLV